MQIIENNTHVVKIMLSMCAIINNFTQNLILWIIGGEFGFERCELVMRGDRR